ncbi:MAG: RpiB/LacA/LacB family sugar-phosphate isomerase [Planctomycetes bacterium]|nr:RpiB/LacA/LacB family sugar-phosphate isomerase [Planctomycetota bacterium]
MRIAVACDHAAVEHKRAIRAHLEQAGHVVTDFGTDGPASCDYPDHAGPACQALVDGTVDRAVLVCGSGIGVSITANKFPGVRCALAYNVETARLAAEHNDAQALAIGARFHDVAAALAMVDAWLAGRFETRHQRRLDKIRAIERAVISEGRTC